MGEEKKFYRGQGKATIAVDAANNIIACLYDAKYMAPRQGEEAAFIEAMKRSDVRRIEGIMLCYQGRESFMVYKYFAEKKI